MFYTGSEPRLAVAGGGGGSGGDGGCGGGSGGGGTDGSGFPECTNGGSGGSGTGGNGRDVNGYFTQHPGTIEAYGGRGASQSGPGAGGATTDGEAGRPASGASGGNGYTTTQSNGEGGGGGGGYYGGGGGADCHNTCDYYGAGGGAGSSWVKPGARNTTYGNDTTATPYIQITYTPKIHKT
jgi:hypothetical protein